MTLAEKLDSAERHTWSDERGTLNLVRLRDGVALLVFEGKLGDEAAKNWEQHFSWVIGRGKVRLFIDGAALTYPTTGFISTGTALVKGIRPRLDAFHALVSGGMVEMIAKTVNLTLGGLITIHRDRTRFEAEMQSALG
jgi:hypothetical protein